MNQGRNEIVADAVSSIGYEGTVASDEGEPEYQTFIIPSNDLEDEPHRALLSICAGTANHQLAGDAQQFWETLEWIVLTIDQLESTTEVQDVLWTFMKTDINTASSITTLLPHSYSVQILL